MFTQIQNLINEYKEYVSLNVVGLIDALVAGARDYLAQNIEEVQRHQNDIKRKILFGSIDIELN